MEIASSKSWKDGEYIIAVHSYLIAEQEARQQIWLRGEKCELAYKNVYIFACNASGMQLVSAHAHWWKVWLTKHVARGWLMLSKHITRAHA